MAITYLQGDATQPTGSGNRIIAHVCNDIGGWGRGFVVAISGRWPEPEQQYRLRHASLGSGRLPLGDVQLVQVEPALWVCNMVAQRGIAATRGVPPIRYPALDSCLAALACLAAERSASVHMPRIGCGLAGGTWDRVGPQIEHHLSGLDVFVYDL